MTESLINEWLADCKDVPPSELHTFANTLSQDNEIVRALYVLLEERTKYSELMDTVCNQLYNFYRSREIELQRFTLQFLPTLIYIYLNSAAHGDIKSCRSLETLLIGLYNLEVVDKSGQQKAVSFRLPSLAMLSIYHEPASLAPASLTESAVRRFEECNTKLVSWGPLQQVETLNAQNRLKVMTALLFIYNQQIGYINKFALEQLCKVATKLVTQGFMKPGHHQRSSYGSESSFVPRILPRIPVSSQFLLEFLHAVYFAMYNDCWCVGNQAAEDIHNRACYEAYPNVMLVTNAIRNSASSGAPGQPSDGPIGVALSPATAAPAISKSMITNASFRTKKLPDDIPIQVIRDEITNEGKSNLVSITEEQESTEPNRVGSMRQSKDQKTVSKITNFPVLGKKPKEKEGKITKNAHVTSSEKEKKLGSQATSKETTKGSVSMLNNEAEIEGNVNGCAIRKKNNSVENNAIIIDPSVALIESERLALSNDVTDGSNMENSLNLRAHNETESLNPSIQVSSV
ncbi:hyccin isoform X1 [Ooceraea biroi]|uniref:Hyccin n=1 Tax=Ooceraea biroi TaxID=2015173 RepID=A0A026WWY0_OOCBI|nr:hyccin isoform X1 [Ooceraea biroi]EZA59614.1 Hyccin [Ooceraea biroi]